MEKNEGSFTLVSPTSRYGFSHSVDSLTELIECYIKRDYCEDVEKIKEEGLDSFKEGLRTDLEQGLSDKDDHSARIEIYGSNKKEEPELASFWQLCWETWTDQINIVLTVLGVVSLIIGATGDHPEYGWIEGLAILIVVFIIVIVSGYLGYSKLQKFKELQELHKSRAGVNIIRDGKKTNMHPENVMVGDIIFLETGDIIPADGIVLQANSLLTNEAAITGENDLMHKESLKECWKIRRQMGKVKKENPDLQLSKHDVPSPVLISGTSVAQGTALFLAVAVGPNSKEGRISELAEQEGEATPLEEKLDDVAEKISLAGLFAGITALVALYLRFFIRLGIQENTDDIDEGDKLCTSGNPCATELIGYFLLAFTVIAVAIPEGLPLAVTICLAYSVKKMQRDNNLVKALAACETMGGVDMICSDKTGTLTQNKMTLKRLAYVASKKEIVAHDEELLPKLFARCPDFFEFLKVGFSICSSARLEYSGGDIKELGSQTELAVIKMLNKIPKANEDYLSIRKDYQARTLKINPFSSARKRSSVIVETPEGGKRIFVIGAPDFIIKHCRFGLDLELNSHEFGELEHMNFIKIQEEMAKFGLRTLTIAYRDLDESDDINAVDTKGNPVFETHELTVISLFGIYDPPRDGVDKAIEKCKHAGIRVRMVTGDNAKTAEAIAREIGITTDFSRVMEGPDFNNRVGGVMCEKCTLENECECKRQGKDARNDVVVNFEVFKEIIENIDVLARSSPEDKYTMVTGLKQLGHVVAVTGDGTNDAPALRKANVGFAMGIAGTEYARQAADIILVDDNFSSIVKAAVWGRGIYENIQKFIQFQLTVNVVAVCCSIVGAITIQQSPLTAVQMLWVNMIMDALASLALATEEPTEAVLDRKPQNPEEFIATPLMFKHIFGQAICMLVLIFIFLFDGENIFTEYEESDDVCHNPDNKDFVCSGRLYDFGAGEDYKGKLDDLGPSRHLTYVFNIFIWFQLFNEFNARRIRDEFWVFEGFFKSYMFLLIWFITAGIQVIVVQVGYWAFFVNKYGLTVEQWFICIAWGSIPFFWRFVLILIPGFGRKTIKAPEKSTTHLASSIHGNNSKRHFSSSYKF